VAYDRVKPTIYIYVYSVYIYVYIYYIALSRHGCILLMIEGTDSITESRIALTLGYVSFCCQQPRPLLTSVRCCMSDITVRSCRTPVGVTLRYCYFSAEFIFKTPVVC